jgi:putative membrane protein
LAAIQHNVPGAQKWRYAICNFEVFCFQSRRLDKIAVYHWSELMKQITMFLAAAIVGFSVHGTWADENRPLDNDFLIKAATIQNAEIQFGKLATTHASAEKVKELGAMMVKDHEKAYDKLAGVIKNRKIGVVAGLEKETREEALRLVKLEGTKFDREFLDWAIKSHKDGIAIFEAQVSRGKDADARDFAKDCLPAMREHLKIAEELSKTIGR